MTVPLRTLLVCLSILVVGCSSSDSLRSICAVDSDCQSGFVCYASECVVAPPVDVPSEVPDAGTIWTCEHPCGTVCCQSGTECRNAVCLPTCLSGNWCGPPGSEVCCGADQKCEHQQCVDVPTVPTCPEGERYDPEFGACLPIVTTGTCERTSIGLIEPQPLWESTPADEYQDVITTPVVIDLDGDRAADVVAPFFSESEGFDHPAVLRALSGVDGHELWATPATFDGLSGISQLAAARLGPGGLIGIVGVDEDGRLSAYRGDTGERLWRSRDQEGNPATCNTGWGAPAIADLDGDGKAEIACGFNVFDSDGVLRWSVADEASGPLGAIIALADLDGDGLLDLTDGSRAYRHDGSLLWVSKERAGLAAVADLLTEAGTPGRDGRPEVVVARNGQLELRSGATGTLLAPTYPLPTWDGVSCSSRPTTRGVGGAPAIGDVNGDGLPEVVVANGECLSAISVTRTGPAPAYQTLWSRRAIDTTSEVTGASLFDFDGDGRLDVAYADETVLHILRGSSGAVWHESPHCSGTVYEEPVIADVDGDGSADLVVARNGVGREELGCDPSVRPGIAVLRDRQSRTANARGIWNQHGYVVPDVCDGADNVCAELGPEENANGRVAISPVAAWRYFDGASAAPYNAARANTHGPYGAGATADAAISDVVVKEASCPAAMVVRVRVVNHGSAPLRPGTAIRIESSAGTGGFSVAYTSRPIPPGGSETVEVPLAWVHGEPSVVVNAIVDDDDATSECDEENNALRSLVLSCPQSRAGVNPIAYGVR